MKITLLDTALQLKLWGVDMNEKETSLDKYHPEVIVQSTEDAYRIVKDFEEMGILKVEMNP
jgi:hypothetical protein